jgi:tetratricopeptide (TPR) repeat protein
VLDEAFRNTQEFRFKDIAEQVRLKQRRQEIAELRRRSEAGDAGAREALKSATRAYIDAELALAEAQVENYPTDLGKRFDLGKKLFQVGRPEDAIVQFQEAKADTKNRANVLHYLGLSFQQIGYHDEAIDTLHQALAMHSTPNDQVGMELRYALMEALLARGSEFGSPQDAEEAYKIAREIAMQQINYKEIRQRREEIKQLVSRLKGTGSGTGGGGSHA